jgi:hypothetical protein
VGALHDVGIRFLPASLCESDGGAGEEHDRGEQDPSHRMHLRLDLPLLKDLRNSREHSRRSVCSRWCSFAARTSDVHRRRFISGPLLGILFLTLALSLPNFVKQFSEPTLNSRISDATTS